MEKWWWALIEILFLAAACSNPKVESETYTTNDALLSTENALIIEMELSCDDVSAMSYHVWQGVVTPMDTVQTPATTVKIIDRLFREF